MKKIRLFTAFLITVLLTSSSVIFAQEFGSISGKVTATDSGEPLIGAQVYVKSTTTGTVTDVDGNYTLELMPGAYSISVSYIGYATKTASVEIASGVVTTMNFDLASDLFGLDEFVVTATFAERTKFESPLSLTSLSANDIQRLTANSQADILRVVPGITAEGGGGEVAANVFVRGLPSGGQYQFTPLQIDGLPVLSAFGLNSSAHDVYFRNDIGLRDLEFVRGGASILFGAGSVAGIINYSSVTGSAVPENIVQLEWADGGRSKVDFLASGPMSKNTFYSFSGFYRYDEGPLYSKLNTVGAQLRGNIKTLLDDGRGVFIVSGQYINDKVQFYLPYPLTPEGDNRYSRPKGNDGETIYTLNSGDATSFSFDTPNGVYQSQIDNAVMTKGGFLMADLKLNFENDYKLASKVKYATYNHQFNLFLDGDGTHNVPETQADYLSDRGLPSGSQFTYISTGAALGTNDLLFQNRILDRERPMTDIVGDINLSRTWGKNHVTLGVFGSYTTAEDNDYIYSYLGDFRNAPMMVGVTLPDSSEFTTGGYVNGSGSQISNRYYTMKKGAVYLADQIVWERWSLDVGVRWEKATGFVNAETGVGSNTFNKGIVEANDFAVTVAGLFKLSDPINLYANFSRGYFFPELRSVRFSSPGVPQSYEPETIIQAELGAKFGYRKFAGNAAVYYVTLNDRRSVDFVNDGQGGVTEEVLTQSTRTIGLELNGSWFFVKNFNLFGTFTFMNHEFTEFQGDEDLVGNWLRRQPQIMGMVGLQFDNKKLDVSLTDNILGKKFANDANTVELASYGIVRFDIGYTFPMGVDKTFRLSFSVYNLLDSEGVTEGSPRQGNSQISGGEFFVGRPILPRRFFVRATFNF